MRFIEFFVAGVPRSQGSKRAFINKHTGRAVVVEQAGAELKSWRESVRSEAQRVGSLAHWPVLDGPIACNLVFYLPRPASAPKAVTVPFKGLDLDKMIRAVWDAMTGVLFTNDSRIVAVAAQKLFAAPGMRTGCTIRVSEYPGYVAAPPQMERLPNLEDLETASLP